MKWIKGKQRGFTLIELLVAIPIIGLLGLAMGAVLIQLLRSDRITQGMVAIRQVQTAGDWVSGDGLQFQDVTSGIASDNVSSGLPFTLKWKYWDADATPAASETHEVTYSLMNAPGGGTLKQLQRHEVIKSSDNTTISDTATIVARYINASAAATNCRWVLGTDPAETTFIFTVTSVVGTKTESRTYRVVGRAAG
jgi:prepilin-type N-terminal cleavage/methylation domain-containing protein